MEQGKASAAVERRFRERYGQRPDVVVRAPGRVNLLGAHVDYNEGLVLPAAIDRAVWLAAKAIATPILEVASAAFPEAERVGLETPAGGWSDPIAGVGWALLRRGRTLPGLRIWIESTLPVGAGLSSSAALEMAALLAWERLAGFSLDGAERAAVGRDAENHFLGVSSGIMDQFASLHGRADHAVCLDCRDLSWQLVPLPTSCRVVIADSGVRRRLSACGYNDRPSECRQALEILSAGIPGLAALRDVSREMLAAAAAALPAHLFRRVCHVVEECSRVRHGAEALRRGDLAAFGRLVQASHRSSRDLYEVSLDELDLLAETAGSTPGCYGARLTGGGFGGCVAALVEEAAAAEVGERLSQSFASRFGRPPGILLCRTADGAEVVSGD